MCVASHGTDQSTSVWCVRGAGRWWGQVGRRRKGRGRKLQGCRGWLRVQEGRWRGIKCRREAGGGGEEAGAAPRRPDGAGRQLALQAQGAPWCVPCVVVLREVRGKRGELGGLDRENCRDTGGGLAGPRLSKTEQRMWTWVGGWVHRGDGRMRAADSAMPRRRTGAEPRRSVGGNAADVAACGAAHMQRRCKQRASLSRRCRLLRRLQCRPALPAAAASALHLRSGSGVAACQHV